MEIKSLEVDFDKGILIINGKKIEDVPVTITLPGPEERFPYRRVINCELATGSKEECDRLTVMYEKGNRQ